MACNAKNVVKTALSEVGYKETGTNHNKFAAYIDKNYPDFYNYPKQNVEWCDVFVDYCVLVNSASEEEALSVLCQPKKSAGAGCKYSYNYYKAKKRTGKEAKIGAQIFFGNTEPTHTGIVVDITDTSVITVEGNSGDQVKKHTYKKDSSKIFGYGYPRYTEEDQEKPEPTPEPAAPASLTDAEITAIAKQVREGKFGNDPERKAKLIELYGEDGRNRIQARVNELISAEKKPSSSEKPSGSIYKVKTFTGAPLNLRKKPNINSAVITTMGDGTEIEVLSIKNRWAQVKYRGITGYCTSNRIVKIVKK